MAGTIDPIPDNYPRITPYLSVGDAAAAIDFYTRVLGAEERMRMPMPGGRIGHAELQLGDGLIMLADEAPEMGFRSPTAVGGTPVTICVYVADVDETFRRAIDAGAREVHPVANQFHGDRSGQFEDPFGHRWSVSSRIEELSADELARRAQAAMEG